MLAPAMGPTPTTASAHDRRPLIYAILDGAFFALYVFFAVALIPSRALAASILQWVLVFTMGAACAGMLLRRQLGWWLASCACLLLLLCELLLLVLLLLSASYLAGVYGSFGEAASAMALLVAALSIELVALVPALQLAYLRSRAGRRAYGRAS